LGKKSLKTASKYENSCVLLTGNPGRKTYSTAFAGIHVRTVLRQAIKNLGVKLGAELFIIEHSDGL
jgi:hypothetical protein